jgi:energy-coupling factor transport system permease protein
MSNRIIFGQYYDSNSWLHRIDPRTKLVSLFLSILFLFIINNIYVLLGYTALLLVLIMTTKTPINKFFKSINMMTYIMIFTFVFQVLSDTRGDMLCNWDFNLTVLNLAIIVVVLALWIIFGKYVKAFKLPVFIALVIGLFTVQYFVNITPNIVSYNIKIYEKGLIEASFIVLRIINFLFLSSLLTLTTKPTEINNGLDKLLKPLNKIGIPTASFSMMISVTLRYIPTLIHEADIVLKSQASRGADFKEVNFFSKVFQMVSLIIPLFVLTYKKAYDLTFAMEARGYVDNKERSSVYELKYHHSDIILYVFATLLFVFSIISRFIF